MTRPSQQQDAPWRAEGEPVLVAVHALHGQARPLLVTALRPLPIIAAEALQEADRLLCGQGARLAGKAGVQPAYSVPTHSFLQK